MPVARLQLHIALDGHRRHPESLRDFTLGRIAMDSLFFLVAPPATGPSQER